MTENAGTANPSDISGAIALVTGAAGGIGLAITKKLAAQGARVIATGRNKDKLDALRGELDGRVIPMVLDVSDAGAVAVFPDMLPDDLCSVDILINNAGHDVSGRRAFYDGEADDWDRIIETNVNGMMRVTRAVIPGMLERGRGHIINLGSVAGLYTYAGGTAYNASKFAVRGFTEALRKDLSETDLRVTEILPGLVRTDFATNRLKGDKKAADRFYDSFSGSLMPEDIAECVLYALRQPPHVTISQLVVEPTRTGRRR